MAPSDKPQTGCTSSPWTKRDLGAGGRSFGYGSIPINTMFSGMNIHLPAILVFTMGIGF